MITYLNVIGKSVPKKLVAPDDGYGMEVRNKDFIHAKTNQDTMIGRPPKRAMIVWVLGILLGIAYTLNAYHFNHSNIIGVLLGLAWTGTWIIYAIQVWHQEIVECWLRIQGKNRMTN